MKHIFTDQNLIRHTPEQIAMLNEAMEMLRKFTKTSEDNIPMKVLHCFNKAYDRSEFLQKISEKYL